jgi:hypothetical protein
LLSKILDEFRVTLIEDIEAMKSMRFRRSLAVLATCGTAAILGATLPAHAAPNPPIQTAQGVEYMCGGTNKDEAAFMQMVAPRWAATIELGINGSPAQRASFPARAKVEVRERYTGRPIMEALSQGPYMLARLDPGAYDVNVTLGGLTLTQPLVVFAGIPSKATFMWPSNFDMASVLPPQPETQAMAQTSAAR